MSVYDKYETVIGLETHVQLATATKAFCSDAVAFGASPNTQISTVSLAYPGTLPKINAKQIEFAIRLGVALGCRINLENRFDRKNYFYADLPKGYQITQDRLPICIGGTVTIRVNQVEKKVRIHHIHIEEDAGKSIHDMDDMYSLIDLNRAGTPLLEIVSEPDLRSADEVDAFMSTMRQLVRYLEISDGNMEQGSLRCDCNVSVRLKEATKLGNRCEIKNLNSMRFARRAIEFEVKRQIDIIEAGGKISQQTLHFDPISGVTSPLRDKENAHDYRYFPEPDLPPLVLSQDDVARIVEELPLLPWEAYQKCIQTYQLSDYDAVLITEEKAIALFFLELVTITPHYKGAANLMINKIIPYLKENQQTITDFPVSALHLAEFIALIQEEKVSNSVAYNQLFPALLSHPNSTPQTLAEQLQLLQNSDDNLLVELIQQVIAANPDKVKAYQKGKKGLVGFFMGELMKLSKGQANPKEAQKMLEDALK